LMSFDNAGEQNGFCNDSRIAAWGSRIAGTNFGSMIDR
jgi:hypothetical protein